MAADIAPRKYSPRKRSDRKAAEDQLAQASFEAKITEPSKLAEKRQKRKGD